jgi:sugar-phosphatase
MAEFRCKAFLFDMDGVLVDSRAVVERTWQRWAAERHPIDLVKLLHVAHGRKARDTLLIMAPGLATDTEVAWLDATELADVEGLRVLPGAKELVAALPRDRWAIVTSCGRDLARVRLGSVGLPEPEELIVAEEVERGKPAPDGYRLGAERLGFEPRDCIVFEDAPAGVAAGKAAGARVLALTTNYAPEHLQEADATITDLRSIHVHPERDGFVVTLPSQR